MVTAKENGLGVTGTGFWSDMSSGKPYEDVLKKGGVSFDRIEVPHLIGMAGSAYLLCYVSPKSGSQGIVI